MASVFYDHLIPWDKLEQFLQEIDADPEERWEIIAVVEETVHTEVIMLILTHLPEEKHEEFLVRFHAAPHHETHLIFIREHSAVALEDFLPPHITLFLESLLERIDTQ